MRILYGYSNCTDETYNRIVSERNVSTMMPDQKYHSLMIKGFSKNGAEVRCFSGLPINRAVTSRKLIREKDEQEGNAYYHYITTLNLPGLRQLMIFFGTFFGVLFAKKDKETFSLCDGLNFSNALGLLLASKLKGIKSTIILTDLPNVQTTSRFRPWLNGKILDLADGYIFLTEPMNEKINRKKKPYVVLEGHVDSEEYVGSMCQSEEEQTGTKIVMYAGSLHIIYGIKNLVDGFLLADIPNCELHTYGGGDYAEELTALSKSHPSIKYFGVKSNSEIIQKEKEASLLVNPRPTKQDFTPYSFPSKNLEYMMSGTPLLTTKLPGMPREYYPYVYFIEDESIAGIANSLRNTLCTDILNRKRKAAKAQAFVKSQISSKRE